MLVNVLMYTNIYILLAREREANSMAFGWEQNKHQAANHANPHRQHHQKLLCLLRRLRTETLYHILIKQSHRGENQYRSQCMEEINKLQPVLGRLLGGKDYRTIDDPQAVEGGQAIADLASVVPDAVGEAEKERDEAARA